MVAAIFFSRLQNISMSSLLALGWLLFRNGQILESNIKSWIYVPQISRHQDHISKCISCLVMVKITIFIVSVSAILDFKMATISYTSINNPMWFFDSKNVVLDTKISFLSHILVKLSSIIYFQKIWWRPFCFSWITNFPQEFQSGTGLIIVQSVRISHKTVYIPQKWVQLKMIIW